MSSHTKNTAIGIELVRELSCRGLQIFNTESARQSAKIVGLSKGYLVEALHLLANSGWIIRLRNGLYAISTPLLGSTAVHEFEIALNLVHPAAISHWSAMLYHGLTEQVPRDIFVTTTAKAVPRHKQSNKEDGFSVGNVIYRFIQVKPHRFFGIQKVWIGNAQITITDVERTLIDGLTMPGYCGDFAEVLNAFELQCNKIDIDKIISYALKLDASTIKRLGWVLQKQGINDKKLSILIDTPIKGYRILDPTGPRKGSYNKKWMIQENLQGNIQI